MNTFTAYIEFDPESEMYIGSVPAVPGAHTQAASLEELYANLREVAALCLEEFDGSISDLPRFVGIHQIEFAE